MWWLIKGSFWFSLVLVLLPLFNTASSQHLANAPPVEMSDAFTAATGAYAYLTNICTDKPDVCEKGAKTFTALGYRAREGARIAFDYLNTKFADKPASALASAAPAEGAAAQKPAAEGAFAAGLKALPGKADAAIAAVLPGSEAAEQAVAGGIAAQPMPSMPGSRPAPYRPPVADKVVTGTVPGLLPAHVPVPLPRPAPDA